MSLRSILESLDSTAWSIALRESLYVYPLIESTHVVVIMLSVGTLLIVNLRLLGVAFRHTPISQVSSNVLPWTIAGLAISAITGLLLFFASSVDTYHNIWFRAKLFLIVIAAINAWLFHKRLSRSRLLWDHNPRPPIAVRVSSGISIAIWLGIIVASRMIDYDWLDCDQPQPEWTAMLAGCTTEEIGSL